MGRFRNARQALGIFDSSTEPSELSFSLLDNKSPSGLNTDRLKEMGIGKGFACIADVSPSETCKGHLASMGITNVQSTMLRQMTAMVTYDYDEHIIPWFSELSRSDYSLLSPVDLSFLEGKKPSVREIRASARERGL